MNADTYLLLSTVLNDQPCIDASLTSAVCTAPFATHSVVQQCYYFLHVYSCARAQLSDTTSAYNTVVQYTAVQQQLKSEELTARIVLPSTGAAAGVPAVLSPSLRQHQELAWPLTLPPVVPASGLDVRLTIIGSGAVARYLLRMLLRDASCGVSGPAASSTCFAASMTGKSPFSPSTPTQTLFHPSRITVLARQPQTLGEFTSQGVRSMALTHGRAALRASDVVVLAFPPPHLSDITRELISSNSASCSTSANDNATSATTAVSTTTRERPAILKETAVVLSTLAAVPIARVASSIAHDPRLILRTRVEAPSRLPTVANDYQRAVEDCATRQVRDMADRDSFLREAVEEAEAMAVATMTGALVADATQGECAHDDTATFAGSGDGDGEANSSGAGGGAQVPREVTLRAAMRAAKHATGPARYLPPTRGAFLLAVAPPPEAFLTAAWQALQHSVRTAMEAATAAEERRSGRSHANTSRPLQLSSSHQLQQHSSLLRRRPHRRRPGAALLAGSSNSTRGVDTLLVQLCAALAVLPPHGARRVVAATLQGYGVLPPTAAVEVNAALGIGSGSACGRSTNSFGSDGSCPPSLALAAGSTASVDENSRVLVPRAYRHEPAAFWRDSQQQLHAILAVR